MELERTAEGSIRIEARLGSREAHQDFNRKMYDFMIAFCGKEIRVQLREEYATKSQLYFSGIVFLAPPEQAVRAVLAEAQRLYPTEYHKVKVGVSIVTHFYSAVKGT